LNFNNIIFIFFKYLEYLNQINAYNKQTFLIGLANNCQLNTKLTQSLLFIKTIVINLYYY